LRLTTFLAIAFCGLAVAAGILVLASALDEPFLYVVALAVVGMVLVARTMWRWDGDVRGWMAASTALLATIALAWLVQRLAA
jgi:hypothetical protein